MAKTIRQQRERQKKFVFLLSALLIGMGIVLYIGFGRPGGAPPSVSVRPSDFGATDSGPLVTSSSVGERGIVSVSLDLSVLDSATFLGLRVFGDLPIILGEIGRSNPFLPVEF